MLRGVQMTRDELNRIFRKALLGVAATPLFVLPGCGRSLPYDDEPPPPVITSIDAGYDGGFDAGHRVDAGGPWTPKIDCNWNPADSGISLAECKTLCAPILNGQTLTACTPSAAS